MKRTTTKKLLAGALAAGLLALQVPVTAFAATDGEAALAAQQAVEYLKTTQQNDGSIAPVTDWAVVAIAASGQDPSKVENGSGVSAVDNLAATTPGVQAIDLERQIIAIAAAGKDTTDFNGTNYDALLAATGNNGQIGDAAYLNDDIFGIIAAGAANDSSLTALAQDGLNYMLVHQNANGGFSYNTDCSVWCGTDSNMTAAAIIAMKTADDIGLTHADIDTAQANALTYLLQLQQDDGGFALDEYSAADGASTAWGLMALNALGTNQAEATAARDWLLAQQIENGRFSIYYSAYDYTYDYTADAAVALLGTTWLLNPTPLTVPKQPAEQPAPPAEQPAPVVVTPVTTTPKPTKTEPVATPDPESETLAAETSTGDAINTPTDNKTNDKAAVITAETASSAGKYIIYTIIALSLIGFGWYLFQPKKS